MKHLQGNPHREAVETAARKGKGKKASGTGKPKKPVESKVTTRAQAAPVPSTSTSVSGSASASVIVQKHSRTKHALSAPVTATKPIPEHGDNVISQFLEECGLGAELARELRMVGITDATRIRALGALPSAALDRLEKSLGDAGLDFAACMLVREGLKRRAMGDSVE